jgi:hypothetical protein
MTREEAIIYLKRADVTVGREPKTKTAEALEMAIKALEQETVSKESYDHEYFLRKEFEIKIARLEHDKNIVLDKIRAEIEGCEDRVRSNEDYDTAEYVAYTDAITDALVILDKYKADTENT